NHQRAGCSAGDRHWTAGTDPRRRRRPSDQPSQWSARPAAGGGGCRTQGTQLQQRTPAAAVTRGQTVNALKRQSGAVAIEFALLFLGLFAVLYGTIAFSVPLAIQASLKHLAAEAARSAIRVEPSGSDEEVGNHLQNYLQSYLSTEGRSWVPRQWYTGCEG